MAPPSRGYDDRGFFAAVLGPVGGFERAEQMVDQCLQVSPATHPPCSP
jgi:hypothetical protein